MKKFKVDKRFCREALGGLKSYGHMGFTIKFMERIKLPLKHSLTQMLLDIGVWLSKGNAFDCINLLEYVDDLKMWGKQRIFLFSIDYENAIQLSDIIRVRRMVGKVYDNPVYEWQIDKPTLVHVKKTKDSYTEDSLLIFKFIEMRQFNRQIGINIKQFEERSTNFFIINLSQGIAELRLQRLPINAKLNLREEYDLFIEEIKKYLGDIFDRFKPITLERAMRKIFRKPKFRSTIITFVAGQKNKKASSTFLTVVNHLFKNPRINYIAGYWIYKQRKLGKSKLYFSLYGNSNSIEIGGLADPDRIRDILKKIVNIYNRTDHTLPVRLWLNGLIGNLYQKLKGQPKTRAFVLVAGAVAALIIWIIMEGIGNYVFEEEIQRILGRIPYIVPLILIEICWIIAYYGWVRTIRSFKALRYLSRKQIYKLIKNAKENKDRIIEEIRAPIISHYIN